MGWGEPRHLRISLGILIQRFNEEWAFAGIFLQEQAQDAAS